MLAQWPGSLVFVSHDRAFVAKVATRLLIFENRKIISFEGDYRDYLHSQNNQVENQEVLVLKMRMAELTGRLGMEPNEELRGRYQEEIERISGKIRLLKDVRWS